MIAYLLTNDLPNTAAALRAESNLEEDVFDEPTAKKYEKLLEKKWTSVVRLQKKVRLQYRPSIPSLTSAYATARSDQRHAVDYGPREQEYGIKIRAGQCNT